MSHPRSAAFPSSRALALALLVAPAGAAMAQHAPIDRTRDVRVCAGGDVTLGTNLDTTWASLASRRARRPVPALPDPARILAPLVPLVEDADVVLLNLEGAIGEGDAPPKCPPGTRGCFAMRQPPATAPALRALAPEAEVVANVANNHARDAGADGLAETVQRLDRAGVHVTGADTLPTLVVTRAGDTVAVLGFGTATGPDSRDLDAVRRHVARAAARWPRLVVTMHLGAEGAGAQRTRDTMEVFYRERRGNPVAFARAAVEAGARLVVGHGPHVVRAIAWDGDALIAYSLGNLVTYGPFVLRGPTARGGLLCVRLGADGAVRDARFRPTRQRPPGLVAPDITGRAIVLLDSLSRLDAGPRAPRVLTEARLRRPGAP